MLKYQQTNPLEFHVNIGASDLGVFSDGFWRVHDGCGDVERVLWSTSREHHRERDMAVVGMGLSVRKWAWSGHGRLVRDRGRGVAYYTVCIVEGVAYKGTWLTKRYGLVISGVNIYLYNSFNSSHVTLPLTRPLITTR